MALNRAAYIALAAFGGLWGVWGAAVPEVQHAAHVSDGGLGTALLCVGAGALPAMLVTGRAVDRFGGRAAAAGPADLRHRRSGPGRRRPHGRVRRRCRRGARPGRAAG